MSRRTVRPRANDARSYVASLEQRIAELEQQQRTAELVTDALTTDDDLDIRFQVTTAPGGLTPEQAVRLARRLTRSAETR